MSRFVRPETVVLPLSDGDSITVKKWLTEGEQRAAFARMYKPNGNGDSHVDPQHVGISMVLAYLLDWTLTDEGKQVVIREQPIEVVQAALDSLHPEDFDEIREAIKRHEDATAKERQEKKLQRSAIGSAATSASVS